MQPEPIVDQFRRLSTEDQLRLLHDLWDVLAQDPDAVVTTDAQRALLDQRLEALEEGRTELHAWSKVRDRLEKDL